MNAVHPRIHADRTTHGTTRHTAERGRHDAIDWVAQIKLAVVLSAVAAMVAVGLAGRIAEPVLIVGVIVVASVISWARVEPVAQPARVRSHHTR